MTAPVTSSLSVGPVLQTRGVGLLPALRETLPVWVLELFAAVTHLGDTEVLLGLAFLAYLAYDRRDGAFVLGLLLVGFAVTVALKAAFGLPRPPVELQYVRYDGFGFPSGHALGSTVGWGGLAVALERVSTRRRRALAAGTVVAVVALSRVVIGVHYLVDVVAGVAIGLVVLAVATRWLREEPLGLFALAGGASAVAVATSGASIESVALVGGVVGALWAWQVVDPAARPYGRMGVLAAGGVGVVAAGGAAAALDTVTALAFAGAALLAVAVLLAPLARERWLGG